MKHTEGGFVIGNVLDLELALMEDNQIAVQKFADDLDRQTSNEAFRRMGEHFGFPTVEIEGVVRGSAAHISRLLGYKKTNYLIELLERWGIYGINIGGWSENAAIQLKQVVGLDPNDNRAILLPYSAVLVAAMHSTNEEAKLIKTYLLRCEQIARNGSVTGDKDMNRIKVKMMNIQMKEKIINLLDRVQRMKNGEYKLAAIDELEELTDRKFTRIQQDELDFAKGGQK